MVAVGAVKHAPVYARLSGGMVWHIRSDVWTLRGPMQTPDRTTCCGRLITRTTRLQDGGTVPEPVCATCARVARS